MSLAPQDIETIVRKVVETLQTRQAAGPSPQASGDWGLFDTLDDAIAAAKEAQRKLDTVAVRHLAVKAIRAAARSHARALVQRPGRAGIRLRDF